MSNKLTELGSREKLKAITVEDHASPPLRLELSTR
jgi:hypothetical protein